MIAQYTSLRFDSGDKLLQYALNSMNELGGTHIFLFNLVKQKAGKGQPEVPELAIEADDIVVSKEFIDSKSPLDRSLSTYLKFLYVEHPQWARIRINSRPVELENPYSLLKSTLPIAFTGTKLEKFSVQLLDSAVFTENMSHWQA